MTVISRSEEELLVDEDNFELEEEGLDEAEEVEEEEVAKDPLRDVRSYLNNGFLIDPSIQAYIVPNHDDHASEYLAEKDKRLQFISGFSGSSGTAVITAEAACLWTDSRFFDQAEIQLKSDWTLMRLGLPETLTEMQWIGANLSPGSNIGADPKLFPYPVWESLAAELKTYKMTLIPVLDNIIDAVWGEERPKPPLGDIEVVKPEFSGVPASTKLIALHCEMIEEKVDVAIITALDDIAWLLNTRGNDIPYNPVYFSFLVVVRLKRPKAFLFVEPEKITEELEEHIARENIRVQLHPYSVFYDFLSELITIQCEDQPTPRELKKYWLPSSTNYRIYSVIPPKQRFTKCSPVSLMKAVKNKMEIDGMANAHVKDGVALCRFLHWLEKEVSGTGTTETGAQKQLEIFRSAEANYVGPAFEMVSSTGPNTSVSHYTPKPDNDLLVSEIYLFDSGAHYQDGTTDVSRTIFFGEPSDMHKISYTRVLKGVLQLSNARFPKKTVGHALDVLARQFLWDIGLDYNHGTGHGVGAFLNVHEGPMGISYRPYPDDPGLVENMFLSVEPGFYMKDEFGVRLENILLSTVAEKRFNFRTDYIEFQTVTLCPYQNKMMDLTLLDDEELYFINAYHTLVRETLGPILKKRQLTEVLEWLEKQTVPLDRNPPIPPDEEVSEEDEA